MPLAVTVSLLPVRCLSGRSWICWHTKDWQPCLICHHPIISLVPRRLAQATRLATLSNLSSSHHLFGAAPAAAGAVPYLRYLFDTFLLLHGFSTLCLLIVPPLSAGTACAPSMPCACATATAEAKKPARCDLSARSTCRNHTLTFQLVQHPV